MSADKLKEIAGRAFPEADHRAARCYAAAREAYDLGRAERQEEFEALQRRGRLLTNPFLAGKAEGRAEERKALREIVAAFQHWGLGYVHKCHICGTVCRSR